MKKSNIFKLMMGIGAISGSAATISSCGKSITPHQNNPIPANALTPASLILFNDRQLRRPLLNSLTSKFGNQFINIQGAITATDIKKNIIISIENTPVKAATAQIAATVIINNNLIKMTAKANFYYSTKEYAITDISIIKSIPSDTPATGVFVKDKLYNPLVNAIKNKTKSNFIVLSNNITVSNIEKSKIIWIYGVPVKVSTAIVKTTVIIGDKNFGIKAQVHFYVNTEKYLFTNIVLESTIYPLHPDKHTIPSYPIKINATIEGAKIGLSKQLSSLKYSVVSDLKINVTKISANNIAIGTISYKLYESVIIATHYRINNLAFQTPLQWNKDHWETSDINSLLNSHNELAMRFAAVDYASYHGVVNGLNRKDLMLNYDYKNPDHILGYRDPNQKGLTPAQKSKIEAANHKLISAHFTIDGALKISYRALATTPSLTDQVARQAYTFTFTKTWKFNDKWSYDGHGAISDIKATLTEATKQYAVSQSDKKLPNNTNLIAVNNQDDQWIVRTNRQKIATIKFDQSQYDVDKQWSIKYAPIPSIPTFNVHATIQGAESGLTTQITSNISAVSDLSIKVSTVSNNNMATGIISYKLKNNDSKMKNIKFNIALKFNYHWEASNLNNLFNPDNQLAIQLAQISDSSWTHNNVLKSFNQNDSDLKYNYKNPDHIIGYQDPNQKGLTPVQKSKIEVANRHLISSQLTSDGALIINYRAQVMTKSATDQVTRQAYSFTLSQKWSFQNKYTDEGVGTVSNIKTTLTEAVKQAVALFPIQDGYSFVADPHQDNVWWVMLEGAKNTKITFDPLAKNPDNGWSFKSYN